MKNRTENSINKKNTEKKIMKIDNKKNEMKKILVNMFKIIYILSAVVMTAMLSNKVTNDLIKVAMVVSLIANSIIIFKTKMFREVLENKSNFKNIIAGVYTFLFTRIMLINFISYKIKDLEELLIKINIKNIETKAVAIFLAALAAISIFIIIKYIIIKVEPYCKKIYSSITSFEKIIFSILTCVGLIFIVLIYNKTNVFDKAVYKGSMQYYDVVYTTDTAALVDEEAHINITHPENDLRQPLFAMCNMPFTLVTDVIAREFKDVKDISSILLNLSQLIMLNIAVILMSKLMKLKNKNQMLFIGIYILSYPYLLFALNIEQYIATFFWLIVYIYLYIEHDENNDLALVATTGSLLTSAVIGITYFRKKLKTNILKLIRCVAGFILAVIIFGNIGSVSDVLKTAEKYTEWTGKTVQMSDKINQYSNFVTNCFVAPKAEIRFKESSNIPTYAIDDDIKFNYVGLAIFILVIISYIINRKDKLAKISFGWCMYSIIILLIVGWGTKENGLILYALYFSWAFVIMIYKLIEKVFAKKTALFTGAQLSILVCIAYINIKAILDLVQFGIVHYPYK